MCPARQGWIYTNAECFPTDSSQFILPKLQEEAAAKMEAALVNVLLGRM